MRARSTCGRVLCWLCCWLLLTCMQDFPFYLCCLFVFFSCCCCFCWCAGKTGFFLHHVQVFFLYLCFFLVTTVAFVFCYLCADRTLFTWQVTNMIKIFRDLDSFNYALSEEDVSRVTDMHEMFDNDNAYSFDQDLSKWDVSLVSLRHGRDVFLCSFLWSGLVPVGCVPRHRHGRDVCWCAFRQSGLVQVGCVPRHQHACKGCSMLLNLSTKTCPVGMCPVSSTWTWCSCSSLLQPWRICTSRTGFMFCSALLVYFCNFCARVLPLGAA